MSARLPRPLACSILAAAALGCAASCVAQHTPPAGQPAGAAPSAAWRLVWSDEFDGPSLDESKWRVEDAALVKNQELQYYDPAEVYVEDGCLVLRSRERSLGGRAYTSGLVDTQERFAQAFGRFEIRAKLPKGQGIWPAHWMLPDDHPAWPPELDIMELLGHEPNTVHLTQHWGTWPNNAHHGVTFTGPDFSEGFHVFAMEWSPDRIDWLVDGVVRHTSTQHVPRIPFYIILNTAVGGEWPGNPDQTTRFPQHHVIDYVRVYTRDLPNGRTQLQTRSPNGRIAVQPPRHDFDPSESATLTPKPAFGFVFDRWEGEGIDPDQTTLTLPMDRSRAVTARFAPDPALGSRLTFVDATATTSESPDLAPEKAIDARHGSRWASRFEDNQSLTLDLGRTHRLGVLRILWENAHAARFHLETSTDGEAWRRVHSQDKLGPAADVVPVNAEARFVRIVCERRATRWGNSIWEVEAYQRR